jgi:oligoribonuclease NrnB/cAMP/cGMP phosphodiesterase (DHH superfamily)
MIYVLFHSKKVTPFRPCMDGLFAAAIAKLAIPNATLIPAEYGNPPELKLSEHDLVYLLDLSYPHAVIQNWTTSGASVKMVDHHKTAQSDLDGWMNPQFDSVFNMQKSGAMLAWETFFPDEKAPDVVRYVQDRDIWIKALPGCDLCSLGLSEAMHDRTFDQCLEIAIAALDQRNVDRWIRDGEKVNQEMQSAIESAVSRAKWRIVGGWNVPTVRVQKPREIQAYSDIGNALIKRFPEAPFACVMVGSGFALRSIDDRLDVSTIAKSLAGGGHRNASGCEGDNMLRRWDWVKNWL